MLVWGMVLAVVIAIWIIRALLFTTMHPIRALLRVVHLFVVLAAAIAWIIYFVEKQYQDEVFWPAVGLAVLSFLVGAVRGRIDW